ncbi:hypothetical protein jhhlp_001479 [Lomentospora prolificans]|uniref:DOC domain-containing protein n=1 Tax=Lomentospora prolificans TaxID=41688 RepID=A0A2N3NIE6_9PEZI|nr:hypothetical protein jhhlp_001479 [Lomentospora prolificans]
MDSSEMMEENSDFVDNDVSHDYGERNIELEDHGYEAGEYEEGDESTQEADDEVDDELEEDDEGLAFDPHPPGLKEISNLGKFTVSTHKQDNGVEELRSDDLTKFWQSDGTQPHNLTVYFVKKVGIREIRFYVDYDQDESYTPTRIIFKSGTSENGLIRFAAMDLLSPKGWQKVPLEGVGGGPDGNTLFCWVFQMSITENHQNGKDTHLRGIKIFALDTETTAVDNRGADRGALEESATTDTQTPASTRRRPGRASLRRVEGDPETPIRTRNDGDGNDEGGVPARRGQQRGIFGVADLSLSAEFMREPELR